MQNLNNSFELPKLHLKRIIAKIMKSGIKSLLYLFILLLI